MRLFTIVVIIVIVWMLYLVRKGSITVLKGFFEKVGQAAVQ